MTKTFRITYYYGTGRCGDLATDDIYTTDIKASDADIADFLSYAIEIDDRLVWAENIHKIEEVTPYDAVTNTVGYSTVVYENPNASTGIRDGVM